MQIIDGKIMRAGDKLGWIESGRIYDAEGTELGYWEGDAIYDGSGNKIGWLEGDYVYDADGGQVMSIGKCHEEVEGDGEYPNACRAAILLLFGY